MAPPEDVHLRHAGPPVHSGPRGGYWSAGCIASALKLAPYPARMGDLVAAAERRIRTISELAVCYAGLTPMRSLPLPLGFEVEVEGPGRQPRGHLEVAVDGGDNRRAGQEDRAGRAPRQPDRQAVEVHELTPEH